MWHLFCKSKVNKNGQGRERVILKSKTNLKCVKRMRWHPNFCQLYEQHMSLKILYVPCIQITVILMMLSFYILKPTQSTGYIVFYSVINLITLQQKWFTSASLAWIALNKSPYIWEKSITLLYHKWIFGKLHI